MWPGDVADVITLIPVINRLRSRFAVGRVCVVADHGMISAATIAALEERGLEYILGVRERTSKEVRKVVMANEGPFVPLVIPHAGRPDSELEAKEVKVDDRRYVVSATWRRPGVTPRPARPCLPRCPPGWGKATRR